MLKHAIEIKRGAVLMNHRCIGAIVAVFVLVSSVGCSTPSKNKHRFIDPLNLAGGGPWKESDEPRTGVPTRMASTWVDAVLHQPGSEAERGFGGRIYFYDREGTDPIETEGQLVVYAFVEDGRDPTDNCPNRRFVFPPEQFARHKSDSSLGVGYSFWLPWDAVGGEQMDVSLIARFEPLEGGQMVVSDQTRHRLPGDSPPETAIAQNKARSPQVRLRKQAQSPDFAVKQTTFDAEAEADQQPSRAQVERMKTSTIPLPTSVQRKLRSGPSTGNVVPSSYGRSAGTARVTYPGQGESPRHSPEQPAIRSSLQLRPAPTTPTAPPVDGRQP